MRATLASLIGLILAAQGVFGLAAPNLFLETLRFIQTAPVIHVAAVVRVAFGVALVRAAAGSRAPGFLRVLGFMIVIGGLLTPFVGVWIGHLILDWWSREGPALVRIMGGVSLTLGVLIVYAVSKPRGDSSVS